MADPDARLLTVSCGVALHHARVALAMAGYAVDVRRMPGPEDPDLLAELALTGPHEPTAAERARSRPSRAGAPTGVRSPSGRWQPRCARSWSRRPGHRAPTCSWWATASSPCSR
ncbi:hypothetical protein ACFQY4_28905 [Catellatospora bangladeshensis]|uniref:hypothetical protein n=1 Tax=Catellatospora bangladeshensis TaxID=310355 RepID=UPI00360C2508